MPATVRRWAARVAAVALAAVTAPVLLASPAQATLAKPTASGALTAPYMQLEIIEVRGVGFHVCAFGSAPQITTYELEIRGQRSDGTLIDLSAWHTGTSWAATNCLDVTQNLTTAGNFTVTFTIDATTTSRAGVALGGGTWDLTGQHSWDTA